MPDVNRALMPFLILGALALGAIVGFVGNNGDSRDTPVVTWKGRTGLTIYSVTYQMGGESYTLQANHCYHQARIGEPLPDGCLDGPAMPTPTLTADEARQQALDRLRARIAERERD